MKYTTIQRIIEIAGWALIVGLFLFAIGIIKFMWIVKGAAIFVVIFVVALNGGLRGWWKD